MKFYLIVFLSSQITMPSEQNLAALFVDNREGMHIIKDEKGMVRAAFRWEAVVGIFETIPQQLAPQTGLLVPKYQN